MSNDISNVFDQIIAQAAKEPSETGETARLQKRLEGASPTLVILADTSGSMGEMAGSRSKFNLLSEALGQARQAVPYARLVTFSSWPQEIAPGQDLPQPSGGTALDAALTYIIPLRPRSTLVISDGKPDDPRTALTVADKVTGTIDVIYCGPDSDSQAIAFMRRLARCGGGRVIIHDVVKAAKSGPAELTSVVKGLLRPPTT